MSKSMNNVYPFNRDVKDELPGGAPRMPGRGYSGSKHPTLTGCIHIRPMVIAVPWGGIVKVLKDCMQDPAPASAPAGSLGSMGNSRLFLTARGVGPGTTELVEYLHRRKIAYVGIGEEWIAIPLMSTNALIDLPVGKSDWEQTQHDLDRLLGFMMQRCGATARAKYDPNLIPAGDATKVEWANGYAIDLPRTVKSTELELLADSKKVKPNLANVCAVLEACPEFEGALRYDELGDVVSVHARLPWEHDDKEKRPRPWGDYDTAQATKWLQTEMDMDVQPAVVDKAITSLRGGGGGFNAVCDYLNALAWDGVSRIGQHDQTSPGWLTTYFNVPDSAYTRLVGRYFVMAMVARAFEPGVKVDTMFIFEGKQGLFKGEALKTLVGGCKSETVFGNGHLKLDTDDKYRMIKGKWLYEFQEVNKALARLSDEDFKEFMSNAEDFFVEKYATQPRGYKRRCCFAGTSNLGKVWVNSVLTITKYLKDKTGNRRYLFAPVASKIDIDVLKRDRDQIWAEAVVLYRQGAADRERSKMNVPILSRWWTDDRQAQGMFDRFADAYLWEPEANLRLMGGNEVETELLHDKILGTAGYLVEDVKLAVTNGKSLDRPWQALSSSLAEKKEYLPADRIKGLYVFLKSLGFVTLANKKVTQSCDGRQERHWHFVSVEHDRASRQLIAALFTWTRDRGLDITGNVVKAGPNSVDIQLAVVLDTALDAHPTMTDDLQGALKVLRTQEGTKSIMDAVQTVLGVDLPVSSLPTSDDSDSDSDDDDDSDIKLKFNPLWDDKTQKLFRMGKPIIKPGFR